MTYLEKMGLLIALVGLVFLPDPQRFHVAFIIFMLGTVILLITGRKEGT